MEKEMNELKRDILTFGKEITFEKGGRGGMTLSYLLRYILPAYNYVEFTDGGWRVGMTYIDDEDLFLYSLSSQILNRNVESVILKEKKGFTQPIYSVELY